MKTFEQIVDECFKPRKPNPIKYDPNKPLETQWKSSDLIHHLYVYSTYRMKPYYGKDINEPVVKICKRVLSKPDRFSLVYSKDYNEYFDDGSLFCSSRMMVVVCRDTGQKFVCLLNKITNLSFLTEDEERLMCKVFREWYEAMKVVEHEKKIKREQKRKDKFRQELTDLYKDL